jgi:hypothetical protein
MWNIISGIRARNGIESLGHCEVVAVDEVGTYSGVVEADLAKILTT